MRVAKNLDFIFLLLIILIILGLPFGIMAYEHTFWKKNTPSGAKEFTLTGHAKRGWLTGEVHGFDAITLWPQNRPMKRPVIEVSKGDLVVLKLKSSDVIHGFSLKDFGVFVETGIKPGKVMVVSFRADKVGSFTFSCNSICGEKHENMQGTLIVRT
jgi:heme/copper-type cytochrome/quinol oxidase subunit 2